MTSPKRALILFLVFILISSTACFGGKRRTVIDRSEEVVIDTNIVDYPILTFAESPADYIQKFRDMGDKSFKYDKDVINTLREAVGEQAMDNSQRTMTRKEHASLVKRVPLDLIERELQKEVDAVLEAEGLAGTVTCTLEMERIQTDIEDRFAYPLIPQNIGHIDINYHRNTTYNEMLVFRGLIAKAVDGNLLLRNTVARTDIKQRGKGSSGGFSKNYTALMIFDYSLSDDDLLLLWPSVDLSNKMTKAGDMDPLMTYRKMGFKHYELDEANATLKLVFEITGDLPTEESVAEVPEQDIEAEGKDLAENLLEAYRSNEQIMELLSAKGIETLDISARPPGHTKDEYNVSFALKP